MAVPPAGPHYDDAGWYRYSPTPGSIGPAVIAGHVDSGADGPSVFYRLGIAARWRSGAGDHGPMAGTAPFAVDGCDRFAKAAFPTAASSTATPSGPSSA